jgi:hypothetical protein
MTAGSESYKEKLPKLLRESGFEIDFLNYETNNFDFESEQLFRGNNNLYLFKKNYIHIMN